MSAINSSAVYGLARGAVDARKADQETEAFNTDQAIRTQRLANDTAEAPLRRRALELGVSEGEAAAARRPVLEERQDSMAALNEATAKLTLKERQDLAKDMNAAREKKVGLNGALASFNATSNPQDIADWIGKAHGQKDLKAVRNEDGSITIGRQTLPAKIKNAAGQEVSADDQLAAYASMMLDPAKEFQEKIAADRKLTGDIAKKDADYERAIDVEGLKGDARERSDIRREGRARDRGAADADKAVTAKIGKVGLAVDKHMKTKDMGGGMGMGFANPDDAQINSTVRADAERAIRESHAPGGTPIDVQAAVSKSVDDARAEMAGTKNLVTKGATALAKKGINPRDGAAVGKAANAGDADAIALVRAMQSATKRFGQSIQQYMVDQFPTPKK